MKRIRDYGVNIGSYETGKLNKISDVPGVKVGHVTLCEKSVNTGVTVIMPSEDNLFRNKMIASAHVFNGFGKSTGLMQINELGTLESPIVLTNTLSVGDALKGLVSYKLDRNHVIGTTTGTVNGVVCECNDGYLNDIRGFHVKPYHVHDAIKNTIEDFDEGAVGAGTGMAAFALKGGIGSSSRIININDKSYTIGVLVMTNMGKKKNLTIAGKNIGKQILEIDSKDSDIPDKGSIIIIVATDIPLSKNQMERVSKRTIVGLSRTGSNMSNGSGEVVVGFSTANRIPHDNDGLINIKTVHDDDLDQVFDAVADATEESVLNSMITAKSVVGRDGHIRKSLVEYFHKTY